ncbi:proline--tRNA ligase [Usitatibacter palustris]|uniref:Proline--tRNA ligase n=1 Tax=Usitatibacter palustris TaxID=2732487 RepID=A0A6M4H8P1_9PROT|nr:proline--tRNA ligase [Usitatibacter palustris]QJR15960.1 Proline--tRNA ligase [Usitatibacter palustris]
MRATQFYLATLKEAPQEAELASHKLMMRAGLIRRLASGLYTWMPLGMRVLRRVEKVVREEMNRAGALEILAPPIQPAELWQETGRWDLYGPMMLRIQDRAEREYCYAPTAEEVLCDIARKEIQSYRQLPLNLYQIQTKFRDEIRPRFGVMRAREFIMKDAYSFDADLAGMQKSYKKMYDAYGQVFTRLGLKFRAVAADSGEIGGTGSHEFQVLASSGEDAIAHSTGSDYAANVELAEAVAPAAPRAAASAAMAKVATPGKHTCEDVSAFLGIPIEKTVKSIVVVHSSEGQPDQMYMLLVRGDHMLNEVKASKLAALKPFRFATEGEIRTRLKATPGSLGPVGHDVKIIADRTVAAMSDWCSGANEDGFHLTGVNFGRDLPEPHIVADIRNVVAGDPSPDGKGTLEIARGIEVGHVFQLGTAYSAKMGANVVDEKGESKPIQMGCYGIGVTRIVAAAIEQNHDEKGIIWPDPMAPFAVAVIGLGYKKSEGVRAAADALYNELVAAGIDAYLEDRDERPGVLLADQELIGIPHRFVIGERGLKEGMAEYQHRRDAQATRVPLAQAAAHLKERLGA